MYHENWRDIVRILVLQRNWYVGENENKRHEEESDGKITVINRIIFWLECHETKIFFSFFFYPFDEFLIGRTCLAYTIFSKGATALYDFSLIGNHAAKVA